MSNDILGSLPRVLMTVPEDRLGLVQDFANKLAGKDGDEWKKQGKLFLRKQNCWEKQNLPVMFRTGQTDLASSIDQAERFTKKFLGVTVDIREKFVIPTELPWKNVLVIYDPGLNNCGAVKLALQGQGLEIREEVDLMGYSGSEASNQPTLRIIENSICPNKDTLGSSAKSPDRLNDDGRNYLDLRGYIIAFGMRYFDSGDYLDIDTWTWLPKNRLEGDRVAIVQWHQDAAYSYVRLGWNGSNLGSMYRGARLAINVPLKP